ncbi:hypothetical protein [Paraburkholderia humisilvae]|nr:hypothetical protein [Paraburkholderia humisilvae]
MQTNLNTTNGNSAQFNDVEDDDRDHPSGNPAAQGRTKRPSGQSGGDHKPTGVGTALVKAYRPPTAHRLNIRAAALEAHSAGPSGTKTDSQTAWNKSPSETQKALAEAAQAAKDKIDTDVAKVWQEQVEDIRAWRGKNNGITGAEDIDRQLFKDSEAYMLLAQNAQSRKDSIDSQVKAFQSNLDSNAVAVGKSGDSPDKTGALMKERQTNLESAIADIDDQANQFSALSDKTVNNMRVGTDKQKEREFVSERRGASTSAAQADIDENAQQIERSSSNVSAAEHAAQTNEMPRINNHRERELAYCKELAETARSLNGQLQNLVENETTFKLPGNKAWNIPGEAQSLTAANVVGLGLSVKNFAKEVSDYREKCRQGSLTSDDRFKMAQSSLKLIGTLMPYVPVIGPVLTPFLSVTNMTLDLVGENKHTPVENVYSQMKSQTSHSLFSQKYSSIEPPKW